MSSSSRSNTDEVMLPMRLRQRLNTSSAAALLSLVVLGNPTGVPAEAVPTTAHGDPIVNSGAVTELQTSLPLREVVDPSGKWLAILHGGFDVHAVEIVDLATGKMGARLAVREAYTAIDFSTDGKSLIVGGSGGELTSIDFDPATGALGEGWRVNVRGLYQTVLRALPGGDVLIAAREERSAPASALPSNPTGLTTKPLSAGGYVIERIALPARDDVRQNVVVRWAVPLPGSPSSMVLSPDGRRAFVTAWHANQLSIIDLDRPGVIANVATPAHPLAVAYAPQHGLLYVAAAATDSVAVIDANAARVVGSIDIGMLPGVKVGATPNALALTRDEQTLYVANADEDNVLRVQLSGNGGTLTGAIPTGVYPTDVVLSADEQSLDVLDGKGHGVTANPQYRTPFSVDEPTWQKILQASPQTDPIASQDFTGKFDTRYYIASLEPGLLERVNLASVDAAAGLRTLRDRYVCRAGDAPHLPPVKHVIYLLKENRTYDQVLGDDPRGNGDPQLAMFGKRITPNVHALVDQFVLLDNYRLEGEVSAPGWEFGFDAYATDVNQRTWPAGYGGQPYPQPADNEPPSADPGGALWDDAIRAGRTVRLYNLPSDWVDTLAAPYEAPMIQRDQDRVFQDADVYREWLAEFRTYEKNGNLPALEVMPFSGDHTWGTQPYQFTPNAFVAINDYYIGKMVDVLSHSRYWKDTVIFTTEDDAQNGPDHVSSERSYLIAAGGYIKRNTVDHTAYSMSGLLRTMELLLGLPPMTEYDASGRVMASIFASRPNLVAYESRPNEVSLTERNPPHAIDAALSETMRFDVPDENDPNLLNRVLWDYALANGNLPRSARWAWNPPPSQKWFDPDDGTGGDEEDPDDEDADN
jgi:YVTN family beta-propeller protein